MDTHTENNQKITPQERSGAIRALIAEMAEQAQLERETYDELITLAVEARSLGLSWSQIGDATGKTRQNAWARWSRFTEPREPLAKDDNA